MSILKVSNIEKSFGKTEVLKDISFSLEKGEVLTIIGSSGSGKTTLLRCLNFLETPNSGTITVNGKVIFDAKSNRSLSDMEIRENRLNFGLVFQSFNLFPQYSVLKNLTLARELMEKSKKSGVTKQQIESEAMELLSRVGLSDKANSPTHVNCRADSNRELQLQEHSR